MIKEEAISAVSAISEDKEETFKVFPARNHATKAMVVSIGNIKKSTPAPVATPFPLQI